VDRSGGRFFEHNARARRRDTKDLSRGPRVSEGAATKRRRRRASFQPFSGSRLPLPSARPCLETASEQPPISLPTFAWREFSPAHLEPNRIFATRRWRRYRHRLKRNVTFQTYRDPPERGARNAAGQRRNALRHQIAAFLAPAPMIFYTLWEVYILLRRCRSRRNGGANTFGWLKMGRRISPSRRWRRTSLGRFARRGS